MSAASKFYPFDRTNVFYNLQDWQALLGEIVETNPEAADSVAQVLYETISTLQEPDRNQETIDTLKLGLEWIFPYTGTHKLFFSLFLYQAEGVLKAPDDLETLLTGALEKALAGQSPGAAESAPEKSRSRGVGESRNRGEANPKPKRAKKRKKGKRN
jgi:hypothetical protein